MAGATARVNKAAAAAAEVDAPKTRTAFDINAVEVGEVEEVTGSPFARTQIPEDHPVRAAFSKSWSEQRPLKLNTTTPDETVKALRKVAEEHGVSVRTKVDATSVTFQAQEKRKRRSGEEVAADVPQE